MDHLDAFFRVDILNVGTHSSTRLATECMKNWLHRSGNSQLIYEVDEDRPGTKCSHMPFGQKAMILIQGYASLF